MKHFKFFSLLLLFGLFSFGFAQDQCKLRGEVLDSLGLPLFDASISAFNAKGEGAGFTFTDKDGAFTLELPCGETYEVDIEHSLIESYTENIDLKANVSKKFKIKRSEAISLQAAVIKAQQPITIKGDTIEYNADSFKSPNSETLEDILKNLPGINVDNGKVFYKGKEITTITVGGREVLGGNTKLLNKNLPADAVDKIQLNQKFKQNPFSSSLQDDEQASLNIELKEDKKNLAFGNITAGGDSDEHWDLQEKLFYFSGQTDGTLISDYNTFGKQVFDQEDYFNFFGGMAEFSQEGSIYSLRNSASNVNFGDEMNAPKMELTLNAIHFGYEPNKKFYINGFNLINYNKLNYKTTISRIYNTTTENLETRDEQINEQSLFSNISRIRMDYNFSNNSQLKYRATFNYTENDNNQLVDSYLNEANIGYRNNYSTKNNYNLSQNLSYIKKVGKNDNFGFYVRHQYIKEKPDWLMNSTTAVFEELGTTAQNGVYNLNQKQLLDNNNLQIYSIYNHLVTNVLNFKFKIGANYSWQNFDNNIYSYGQELDNTHEITNTDFTYNQYYFDYTLTHKWGKIKYDVGAGIHYFRQDYTTHFQEKKEDEGKLMPHLNVEYSINNGERLAFNYQKTYNYPNSKDLSDSYRIENYYTLSAGNFELKPQFTNNFTLNYNIFNSFKFFNLYASLGYSTGSDNIQTASVLQGITQVNIPVNNPKNYHNYSATLFSQKRFSRVFSVNVNASVNYSDYHTFFVNGNDISNVFEYQFGSSDLIQNKSLTQNYTLTNIIKLKKKVELKAGLNYFRNNYESLTSTTFDTWKPFGELAWSVNSYLLFQTDYSYQIQNSNGERINEAQMLNASLRLKIFKMAYFTFTGGNLLGNSAIASSSFDNNYTQISRKEILGRYFIASLRFKF